MQTTDNVTISVPNQMLIQSVITNYGTGEVTRRRCMITADFSEPPRGWSRLYWKPWRGWRGCWRSLSPTSG
ncbi:MAG: hypothetical protein ACLFVP_03860 [Candidatus Bathyarchaeia archaeon]